MIDYVDIIYRSAGKGALERLDVFYHIRPSDLPPMLLIGHITSFRKPSPENTLKYKLKHRNWGT